MKKLCLLAAFAALVVGAQAGDSGRLQVIVPGIDTMPPLVTAIALPCGCREFTVTETRNIPDPPAPTPKERDQVESGIQRIRLAVDPAANNVTLSDLTPAVFPKDNSVKAATFRVCLTDKSKAGSFTIEALDWKNNLTKQLYNIAAATPQISVTSFDFGKVKVGEVGQGEVTVTNNGDGPMVLDAITLQNGSRVSISAGGTTPVDVAPNGGTHKITFTYTPTLASENGDNDEITVQTACGSVKVSLKGQGGVSRIAVDNTLNLGDDVGAPAKCTTYTVRNTGNIDLKITDLRISGNAKFSIKNLTPALPQTVPPGGSVTFSEICFESNEAGDFEATLEVISDAIDGGNKTTVKAGKKAGIEDELGQTARAWFDATNGQIVVETVRAETVVNVHDLQGRALASVVADGSTLRLNASNWSGVVVVSFTSVDGPVARSLSLRR